MLRVDNKIQIVEHRSLFGRSYSLCSGKRDYGRRWTRKKFDEIVQAEFHDPIPLIYDGGRYLWLYRAKFYWEDTDLDADDVKALLLDRERSERAEGECRPVVRG